MIMITMKMMIKIKTIILIVMMTFFSYFFLFIALTDDPEVPVCGINETATCVFREMGRSAHKDLVVIKYHI